MLRLLPLPLAALLAVPLIALGCAGHGGGPDSGYADAGPTDAGVDAGVDAGPMCSFTAHSGQGNPCNADADCTTGRCYFALVAGNQPVPGYCTTTCTEASPDCTSGYTCTTAADRGDTVCVSSSPPGLPGDGTLPFGSPCDEDSDCSGAASYCGAIDNGDGTELTFCTSGCDNTQTGACGACGACVVPIGGGSSECQPVGSGAIGAPCVEATDCSTLDCLGFCTLQCAGGGMTPINCPGSAECEPVVASGGESLGLCIDASQIGATPSGSPCAFDFQCGSGDTCHLTAGATSGTCAAGSNLGGGCTQDADCGGSLVCRTVAPGLSVNGSAPAPDTLACTEACSTNSDCGSGGNCVPIDLDTDLNVWTAAQSLFASNDDINPQFGARWSALTQSFPAGTYSIQVSAYYQSQGSYVLTISDASGSGSTINETAGDDDSQMAAQAITAPVTIDGSFSDPGDVDWYTFTLAAADTLTIQIGRGAPSLCMPASQVGQVAWGSACTTDWECASSLCEQALQACGQPCTQNSDCGGVNPSPDAGVSDGGDLDGGDEDAGSADAGPLPICASLDNHMSCVTAGAWGQLAAGADCSYSFQCSNGYCANFCGSFFCTESCSGLGANCGIVVSGMSENECFPMTTDPSGVATAAYACVPTGQMECGSGDSCLSTSDCVSGLTCIGGSCQ